MYNEKSANFQELMNKYGFTNLTPEERKNNTSINGAVYQFKTEMLPDQHGNLKRLEVAHMVTYPDGRSEIFVPDEDEFREAGSTKDKSVVSYLRNDVNQGKSTSADNTVPGVQTVYSNNDTVINYSSPDKRITIIENGKVIQSGQKMDVQPQTLSVTKIENNGSEHVDVSLKLVDEDLGTHTRTIKGMGKNGTLDYEFAGKKFTITNYEDENGQVHTSITSKDENLRTVSSDGYVTNAGSVVDSDALSRIKPSVSNSSLADNLAAGMLANNKKLSDDTVYFTYTTKKDAHGNDIPDQWIETDAKGSFLYKHNDYAGGNFSVSLDKNNGKVSFIQDANGNYKVVTDSSNVVVIKADDNEKLKNIMTSNSNVNLTNSFDTTNTVRNVKDKFNTFTGSIDTLKQEFIDRGKTLEVGAGGKAWTATIINNETGVRQIGSVNYTGNGNEVEISGVKTDPKGPLTNLKGDKVLNTSNWSQDKKNDWASYSDGVKNGTLTGAEKEKAQIKLIEEHGMKLSRNGHLLEVKDGHIVESSVPATGGQTTGGGSNGGSSSSGTSTGGQKSGSGDKNGGSSSSGTSTGGQKSGSGDKNGDSSGMNGGSGRTGGTQKPKPNNGKDDYIAQTIAKYGKDVKKML